jgi:phage major head subunit gpT-like protein
MSGIITGTSLQTIGRDFNAAFNQGLLAAPDPNLAQFATPIPMSTGTIELGMIKAIPGLREWVGDRVFNRLSAHGFTMTAKTYENSIEVPREHIEDDNLGLFMSSMQQLAINTRQHPDELLAALLNNGTSGLAYDGIAMFSASHPENGSNVSNIADSSGVPWYLIDASKPLKPLILGNRTAPEFVAQDQPDSDAVFEADSIRYGVRVRTGVQYGLWQLAYRAETTLDSTNFNSYMTTMMARAGDTGRSLGIRPTHIVVPPSHYATARGLFEMPFLAGGASNKDFNAVKVVVNTYLTNA